MRLFHVRFTIRRIMAAIALVALPLGLGRMWVYRAYCLQRAKWHSMQEAGFRGESDGFEQEARDMRTAGDIAEAKRLETQSTEYHRESEHQARLKQAYEYYHGKEDDHKSVTDGVLDTGMSEVIPHSLRKL